MGIEPTWDSLHCPTPDLKSGSPTSELSTSAMPRLLAVQTHCPSESFLVGEASSLDLAAGRRPHRVGS